MGVEEKKHEVRPGITGWAQVNGRNDIPWSEKFALDVWYVDHQSPALDLRVIVLTLWEVIKREGISREGHASAPQFMGTAEYQE
jgi:lipopolysaccharide/colanic/teichoic acid biosynthesis glycosyltransferase